MKKFNLHGHSKYCDGKGELETYVKTAIQSNYSVLGFSSHAPISLESNWHMFIKDLPFYYKDIEELRNKYSGQIQILKSLEIDFIDEIIGPKDYRDELDYTLGSVHYIKDSSDNFLQIDLSKSTFENYLKHSFHDDIESMVRLYFGAVNKMVTTDVPDIIGHFDLIKKFNAHNYFFKEEEQWYQELVFDCLETISKTDAILEVNTRGNYKQLMNDFYPSTWILKRAIELNIPITLNSDAHVDFELEKGKFQALQLLKNLGLKTLVYFESKNQRVETVIG
ncbi:MAG: histidinol-phosphatase HisJ [Flavobacteriales bacterium]|nr:histidinol-phosphatase HisJ [Flavobacteriales bacterium]